MRRPPAASPGQERIGNHNSDLNQPCTTDNAILRTFALNIQGTGRRNSCLLFVIGTKGTKTPCSAAVPALAIPDGWAREGSAEELWEAAGGPSWTWTGWERELPRDHARPD